MYVYIHLVCCLRHRICFCSSLIEQPKDIVKSKKSACICCLLVYYSLYTKISLSPRHQLCWFSPTAYGIVYRKIHLTNVTPGTTDGDVIIHLPAAAFISGLTVGDAWWNSLGAKRRNHVGMITWNSLGYSACIHMFTWLKMAELFINWHVIQLLPIRIADCVGCHSWRRLDCNKIIISFNRNKSICQALAATL